MARRKVTPNLPADTLARARSQATSGVATADASLPEATTAEPTSDVITTAPTTRTTTRATSKRIQDAQFERSRKKGDLDNVLLKDRLMNPTMFPTPQDLRRDYFFVVKDLRNMLIVSVGLIAMLILIATVAP